MKSIEFACGHRKYYKNEMFRDLCYFFREYPGMRLRCSFCEEATPLQDLIIKDNIDILISEKK